MAANTMTSVIHDNKLATETLTQYLARTKTSTETLTDQQHDLVNDADSTGVVAPSDFGDPITQRVKPTGFTIVWKEPIGGDSVESYEVAVDQDGTTPITDSPFTMAGTTLRKIVTGLTAETSYTITVTATNAGGSDASDPVIQVTPAAS